MSVVISYVHIFHQDLALWDATDKIHALRPNASIAFVVLYFEWCCETVAVSCMPAWCCFIPSGKGLSHFVYMCSDMEDVCKVQSKVGAIGVLFICICGAGCLQNGHQRILSALFGQLSMQVQLRVCHVTVSNLLGHPKTDGGIREPGTDLEQTKLGNFSVEAILVECWGIPNQLWHDFHRVLLSRFW